MYVVFDTSVILSAFLTPRGSASQLITDSPFFLICTSQAIINELSNKLREKGVSDEDILGFVESYLDIAVMCDDDGYSEIDIQEDKHLEGCLRMCRANLILTLDKKRLRKLKTIGVPVEHVSQFRHYFPQ